MRQVIVKALLRLYCRVILLLAFTDGGPWNADAAPFASPGFLAATGWLLIAMTEVSKLGGSAVQERSER
jgi:hypothetical protein